MRYFDIDNAADIARDVIDVLEDEGYTPEQIIPGLVVAIAQLAQDNDQLLDEAVSLLDSAGSEEGWEDE